jgi:hypothetical protein
MPKKLTKILGKLLRVARYAMKTGIIGISKETYQHSDESPVYMDQDKAVVHQHKDGEKQYLFCSIYKTSMDMDINMQTHGNYTVQS